MRRIKTVLGVVAVMVAILVIFAAPALADDRRDHNDNNRFFSSDSEQEADSGDVDQSFTVNSSGDNSNQTVGIQGVANTGNVQNQIGVIDAGGFGDFDGDDFCEDLEEFCDDFNDDFCDDLFDDGNHFFFFFFDDDDEFNISGNEDDDDFEFNNVGSSIDLSPTNRTASDQVVDQAAIAAG